MGPTGGAVLIGPLYRDQYGVRIWFNDAIMVEVAQCVGGNKTHTRLRLLCTQVCIGSIMHYVEKLHMCTCACVRRCVRMG